MSKKDALSLFKGASVALAVFILVLLVTDPEEERFDCAATVGCGTHIIDRYPPGHGR